MLLRSFFRSTRVRVLGGVLALSGVAACANIFGFADLTRPGGSLGDAGDAGGDSGNACTQRAVDDAKGVFVTINGADGSTCGSRTEPCQTVQTGIDQAKLLGRSIVYVARGTYVESVQLAAGITLEGGWDTASTNWIPACDTTEVSAVKLTMPPTSNVVVTANFTGSAGLRLLSIVGKTSAQPGESVYGIFATGASLVLDTISVAVGTAGDGTQGDAGATGATGGTSCDAGDAATGASPGHAGEGASGGTFDETGYAPGAGGPGAADGSAGAPGPCGVTSSTCITTCTTCQSVCVNALAGCGGGPGSGGAGGSGGGSSVAVYGWNASIQVIGGSYASGNGGNGGNGGAGGPGGSGGSGGVKDAVCLDLCSDAGCATVGSTSPQIGGTGGQGAPGGQGGGGAGGSSYVFFNGGDAGVVNVTGSPTIAVGDAGSGGVVGGAPGKSAAQGP